jgi:predicted nucleotidyltransferase
MKEFYKVESDEKEKILTEIGKVSVGDRAVVFAYVYGSFLNDLSFRDIDIGIYLKEIEMDKVFNYELELSGRVAKAVALPFDIIDVKVLNFAPDSFLNNIFRNGKILFSNDYKFLTDMIERTSLDAILNEGIREQSLRDLIPD